MLTNLTRHKLIGKGKSGVNTLTYLENTTEDFNTGTCCNVEGVNDTLRVLSRIDDKCEIYVEGGLPCVDKSPRPKRLTSSTTEVDIGGGKKGLRFVANNYIRLEERIDIGQSEDFTIEFKIKRISNDYSNNRWILAHPNEYVCRIGLISVENKAMITFQGEKIVISNIGNYLPVGEWLTYTIERYKSVMHVYVNNTKLASFNTMTSLYFDPGTCFMNWTGNQNAHFANCDLEYLIVTRKSLYGGNKGNTHRLTHNIVPPKKLIKAEIDWEGTGEVSLLTPNLERSNIKLLLDGNSTTDTSIYANPIYSVKGTTYRNQGKFEGAYPLNEATTFLVPKKAIDLSGNKDFTIHWWERITTGDNGAIMNTKGYATNSYGMLLGCHSSGTNVKVFTYMSLDNTGNVWDIQIEMGSIKANTWVHRALTYTASTRVMKSFEDGSMIASITLPIGSIDSDSHNFYLGGKVWAKSLLGDLCEFTMLDTCEWDKNFSVPTQPVRDFINQTPIAKGSKMPLDLPYYKLKEEVTSNNYISNLSLKMTTPLGEETIFPLKDDLELLSTQEVE